MCLTKHAALRGVPITFLGEILWHGLASVLISQCFKSFIFRCDTSSMMTYNDESHYTINALAVLGQVANGGAKQPAITVVVDGGWSKRSHKHYYNAKSGVGVILILGLVPKSYYSQV